MKRKIVVVLTCVILIMCVCILEFSVCRLTYKRNKEQSELILKTAYEIVDKKYDAEEIQDVDNESIEKSENDILGILYIEKLNIEAPVKEGTTQDVMKTSVGHFTESDFWNGNISLASHNSGTSMHYFKDIHKLQVNDEIKYKTELGERTYKVQTIEKIKDTDWSKVVKNSKNSKNTITLITCINGQPDYRLCVRGIEV